MTTESRTYSVKFTMAQPTDESARVGIRFGRFRVRCLDRQCERTRSRKSSEGIAPSKRTLPRRNGSAHKYDLLGKNAQMI